VTLNGNCINIKNLNQKLEEELTKLKSTQEQIGVKLAIPDNTVENHNAKHSRSHLLLSYVYWVGLFL
jgi:hypothetical protein